MKHVWFTLGATTLLLSGCTGMMYGENTAPVNNRNIYQRGNTVPLAVGSSNPNGVFAPSTQTGIQAQPVYTKPVKQPVQPASQVPVTPYGQNPTLAQTVAGIGNNASQQSNYTSVQQASPYGGASGQDGWNTPPNSSVNNPVEVDEPQIAPPAQSVNNPAQQNTPATEPQAVRPPQRDSQTSSPTPDKTEEQTVAANNTPAANTAGNQQVASANKPTNNQGGGGETAVSSLLKKASASLGKGDLDGAVAYLENAQRIEPQNSKILYDIANIRYHQGKHREAESFASRAVQVGGSNDTMKKSWSLIANARKALGDNQGAIQAAEKATSL